MSNGNQQGDTWVREVVNRAVAVVGRHLPPGHDDPAMFAAAVGTEVQPGPLRLSMYADPKLNQIVVTMRRAEAQELYSSALANEEFVKTLLPNVLGEQCQRWVSPEEIKVCYDALFLRTGPVAEDLMEMDADKLRRYVAYAKPVWGAIATAIEAIGHKPIKPGAKPSRASKPSKPKVRPAEGIRTKNPEEEALVIGARLLGYAAARQRDDASGREEARAYWYELSDAIMGWHTVHGDPHAGPNALSPGAATELDTFLHVFDTNGHVIPEFRTMPAALTEYPGPWDVAEDLEASALWMYRAGEGVLYIDAFVDEWVSASSDPDVDRDTLGTSLLNALFHDHGWRFDADLHGSPVLSRMMPTRDYYSRLLTNKKTRLDTVLAAGEPPPIPALPAFLYTAGMVQHDEFAGYTRDADWAEDLAPALDVRDTYLPVETLNAWINQYVQIPHPGDWSKTTLGTDYTFDTEDVPEDVPTGEALSPPHNKRLDYWLPDAAPVLTEEDLYRTGKGYVDVWTYKRIRDFGEIRDAENTGRDYAPVRVRLRRGMFATSLAWERPYTVEQGDTPESIAASYRMPLRELRELNPDAAYQPGDRVYVFALIPYAALASKSAWESGYQNSISHRTRYLLGYLNSDVSCFSPNALTSVPVLSRMKGPGWRAELWPEGEATLQALLGNVAVQAGHTWTLGDLADICRPNKTQQDWANLSAMFPSIPPTDLPRRIGAAVSMITAKRKDAQREAYASGFNTSLLSFLDSDQGVEHRRQVVHAYNVRWRSYVLPEYDTDNVAEGLVRAGPVTKDDYEGVGPDGTSNKMAPYPYQSAGARRLVEEGGGLLAMGVGVGKTNVAILAMAYAKQRGLAKRPVFVVPNTLIPKWTADLLKQFPDYRVEIIGKKYRPPTKIPNKRAKRHPLRLRSVRLAQELFHEAFRRTEAAVAAGNKGVRSQVKPVTVVSKGKPARKAVSRVEFKATIADLKADPTLYAIEVRRVATEMSRREGEFIALHGGVYTVGTKDDGTPIRKTQAPPPLKAEDETPTEVADKWAEFRSGRFDAVFVPASRLDALPLDDASVREHVLATPAILQSIEESLFKSINIDTGRKSASGRAVTTSVGYTEGYELRERLIRASKALLGLLAKETVTTQPLGSPTTFAGVRESGFAVKYVASGHQPRGLEATGRPDLRSAQRRSGNTKTWVVLRYPDPYDPNQWIESIAKANARSALDLDALHRVALHPLNPKNPPTRPGGLRNENPPYTAQTEGFVSEKLYIGDSSILTASGISPANPKYVFIDAPHGQEIARVIKMDSDGSGPYLIILRDPRGTEYIPWEKGAATGPPVQGVAPQAIPVGTRIQPAAGLDIGDVPKGMSLAEYVATLEDEINDPRAPFRVQAVMEWIADRLQPKREAHDVAVAALYERLLAAPEKAWVVDVNGETVNPRHVPGFANSGLPAPTQGFGVTPYAHRFVLPDDVYAGVVFLPSRRNQYPDGYPVPPPFKRSGEEAPKGAQRNGAYYGVGYAARDLQTGAVSPLTNVEAAQDVAQWLNAHGSWGPYTVEVSDPVQDYESISGKRMSQKAAAALGRRLSAVPKPPALTSAGELITWDATGVDFLVVDEAHKGFKSLYEPQKRGSLGQGKVEYLYTTGNSKSAWQLEFRAAAVRRNNGRVVLLTATPATTSPIEFYNLFQYIGEPGKRDSSVFTPVGINSPEEFISRYVEIEPKIVAKPSSEPQERLAVVPPFRNQDEFLALFRRYANRKTVDDAEALRGRMIGNGSRSVFTTMTGQDGTVRGHFIPVDGSTEHVRAQDRLRIFDGDAVGDYAVEGRLDDGSLVTQHAPTLDATDPERNKWAVFTGGKVPIAPPTRRVEIGMSPEQYRRYVAYQTALTAKATGAAENIGNLMGVMQKMGRTAAHVGLEFAASSSEASYTAADDGKKKKSSIDTYVDALQTALPIGNGGVLAAITPTTVQGEQTLQPFNVAWPKHGDGRRDMLRIRHIPTKDISGEPKDLPLVPAPVAPDGKRYPRGTPSPVILTDPYFTAHPRELLEIVLAFRPGKGEAAIYVATWRGYVVASAVRDLHKELWDAWNDEVESTGAQPVGWTRPEAILNASLAHTALVQSRQWVQRSRSSEAPGTLSATFGAGGLHEIVPLLREDELREAANDDAAGDSEDAYPAVAAYLDGHPGPLTRVALASLLAFGADEAGGALSTAALSRIGVDAAALTSAEALAATLQMESVASGGMGVG